jgi:CO dehydrogenase nickel-insertion accessory protein CooC1
MKESMKNSVHFVLQGKGGIGKTLISTFIAQWINETEPGTLKSFDTDQENATLAAYKGLNVTPIDVMNEDRTINRKMFDKMMLDILATEENIVIDNGANTFSPLMSYLMENQFIDLLQDAGKDVYIHSIIGGGDNLKDTISGFASLAEQTSCPMIVWLNENASWGRTDNFIDSDELSCCKVEIRTPSETTLSVCRKQDSR